MKQFQHPFKPAVIYAGKKQWYVYYHFQDPQTGQWKMFKDRGGLNYIDDLKDRQYAAEVLRDAYNDRLKSGWSPFGYQPQETAEYQELKYLPLVKVMPLLLETKKSTIRRRSWQSYKYSNDLFVTWLKAANLQHITAEFFKDNNARAYSDWLLAKGVYANKTYNGHINAMKVMFNMAIDRELTAKNPFKKIKALPEEVGKNFPFSEKQKADMKKKILELDPDLWKFVKFIYHLYIRPLELLRMKVSDVDFRTNQVTVQARSAKNKKQMAVVIPDTFLEEIKSWWNWDELKPDWYLFGFKLQPGPHSFNRNSVTERHSAILDAAGIDRRHSMYAWKHTGNIDAFLAGVDIYDLMRQNRHHSIEQTMDYLRSLGLRPNINFSSKAPAL